MSVHTTQSQCTPTNVEDSQIAKWIGLEKYKLGEFVLSCPF